MRELLSTFDVSYALSARMALDAASIRYSANFDDDVSPTRSPLRLFVLDDADYDAARVVVGGLQVSSATSAPGASSRRFRRFSIVVGILVALLVVYLARHAAR